MKWWKYVQNLITKDNCFRVRGEGSEVEHVREGEKNLRISSLCLWPAPDSGAKLSLRRRSTPSSTFHLSSLGEHTEDHTKVRRTILWLSLQTHTDLFKGTRIKMTTKAGSTHTVVFTKLIRNT